MRRQRKRHLVSRAAKQQLDLAVALELIYRHNQTDKPPLWQRSNPYIYAIAIT